MAGDHCTTRRRDPYGLCGNLHSRWTTSAISPRRAAQAQRPDRGGDARAAAHRAAVPREVPGICVEVVADERRIDVVAEGFDAGIRYDESLENDMVAIPIGPRVQRYAAAASPEYLARRGPPTHPRDLLDHDCIAWRFPNVPRHVWQFERHGETIHVEPRGPLVAGFGGATDLAVQAAIAGCGILYLFEDWLRPALDHGALVPVLEPSWLRFPGPFLYYPGRRYLPAPLRACVDFIKTTSAPVRTRPRHPGK